MSASSWSGSKARPSFQPLLTQFATQAHPTEGTSAGGGGIGCADMQSSDREPHCHRWDRAHICARRCWVATPLLPAVRFPRAWAVMSAAGHPRSSGRAVLSPVAPPCFRLLDASRHQLHPPSVRAGVPMVPACLKERLERNGIHLDQRQCRALSRRARRHASASRGSTSNHLEAPSRPTG